MHSGLTDTVKVAALEGLRPIVSGEKWELEVEAKSYQHITRWGLYEGKRLVDAQRTYYDLPAPVVEGYEIKWPIGDIEYTAHGLGYDETTVCFTILCDRVPVAFLDYGNDFDLSKDQTLTLSLSGFKIELF